MKFDNKKVTKILDEMELIAKRIKNTREEFEALIKKKKDLDSNSK